LNLVPRNVLTFSLELTFLASNHANPSFKGAPLPLWSFELDPLEGRLSRNGNRVKLQDLPCRLLVTLVERREKSSRGKRCANGSGQETRLLNSTTAWASPSEKSETHSAMMPRRHGTSKRSRAAELPLGKNCSVWRSPYRSSASVTPSY
jgi:hypothetical protein